VAKKHKKLEHQGSKINRERIKRNFSFEGGGVENKTRELSQNVKKNANVVLCKN
jgi:hypothetical protein